jgi:replicative DNA helicase
MSDVIPLHPLSEGLLDLEETLLSACLPILPCPPADEKLALANVDLLTNKIPVHLWSPMARSLYQAIWEYRTVAGGALPDDVFVDMLTRAKVDPERKVKYHQLVDRLRKTNTSVATFRYAVEKFREFHQEKRYVAALNEAFTIQTNSLKIGKEDLKGYRQSREHLAKQLFALDTDLRNSDLVEGELRESAPEVWKEYEDRKRAPAQFSGIQTGFKPLDDLTNGAKPGDLWFIGANTGEGKSFLLSNMGYHAIIKQCKHVVAFVGEMTYRAWKLRPTILHARDPRFGLPNGIDSQSFDRGSLTPVEEEAFKRAMVDLNQNPGYGRFRIVQVPSDIGVEGIAAKAQAINAIMPVDMILLDMLRNMIPGGQNNDTAVLNESIRKTKSMAVNFDKGRGVPIVTAWHANRLSAKKALEQGEYTINSWAEASEVENAADVIVWLLWPPEMRERHEILGGTCKVRASKSISKWMFYEDFASGYLGISSSSPSSYVPNVQQGMGPPVPGSQVFAGINSLI